jgi:hypothetical protein
MAIRRHLFLCIAAGPGRVRYAQAASGMEYAPLAPPAPLRAPRNSRIFAGRNRQYSTKSVYILTPRKSGFWGVLRLLAPIQLQVIIHQQLTTKIEYFQLRSIKPN